MVVVGEKSYKHIDEGPIRKRQYRNGDVEGEDEDSGMRVGSDYQASIPEFNPLIKPESNHEAMLIWSPYYDPSIEPRIEEYAIEARQKYGYNLEQALGMLFWHKHNIPNAQKDLPNYRPASDGWSNEDKVLFEQAFSFHGKTFNKINSMLPDKPVGCLVEYYYAWKKTRSRLSMIDRQVHKVNTRRTFSGVEDDSSDSEGETHSKEQKDKNNVGKAGFGSRKLLHDPRMRNKRRPPKGIHLNEQSLNLITTGQVEQGDQMIKRLNMELENLKREVQSNKQDLSTLRLETEEGLGSLRISENLTKPNVKWSNDELLLAVQGVRKYGKDFKAIAEVIGNKSETLVRSFFVNYRRKYNLDEVLMERDVEKEKPASGGQEEVTLKMDFKQPAKYTNPVSMETNLTTLVTSEGGSKEQ